MLSILDRSLDYSRKQNLPATIGEATEEQLAELPGIGPDLAATIKAEL